MDRVKGRFGFGFMRPPMEDGEIDYETYCRMVDAFLDSGFNYFDMARCYMDGQCEKVMRRCLTSRYPRESYVLTDKLSPEYLTDEAGIRLLFAQQLEDSGVEYFDYYLMHAQTAELFACFNAHKLYHNWNSAYYYEITTAGRGKASDCIACGKCEKSCPQHLPIRQLLQQAAQAFESEEK